MNNNDYNLNDLQADVDTAVLYGILYYFFRGVVVVVMLIVLMIYGHFQELKAPVTWTKTCYGGQSCVCVINKFECIAEDKYRNPNIWQEMIAGKTLKQQKALREKIIAGEKKVKWLHIDQQFNPSDYYQ